MTKMKFTPRAPETHPKRWKAEAIKSLKPNNSWYLDDQDQLWWNEDNTDDEPTTDEINAEAARLEGLG